MQPETAPGWRTAGTTLGGVFAALGILAALHRRDHGVDHAQYIGVSLWQSAMWWSWRDLDDARQHRRARGSTTQTSAPATASTATADDQVALAAPVRAALLASRSSISLELPPEWKQVGDWSAAGWITAPERPMPTSGP